MDPELRAVVETIMSDLGMGEDQSKIDALGRSLHVAENLETFFAENREQSPVIPHQEGGRRIIYLSQRLE